MLMDNGLPIYIVSTVLPTEWGRRHKLLAPSDLKSQYLLKMKTPSIRQGFIISGWKMGLASTELGINFSPHLLLCHNIFKKENPVY
jgi:hypothetical protein